MQLLQIIATNLGLSTTSALLLGIGLGCLLAFTGVAFALADRNPAAARLADGRKSRTTARVDRGLLRDPEATPQGLAKIFVPTDLSQRTKLTRDLAQAGFSGPNALRNYTLARVLLGFMVPGFLLMLIVLGRIPGMTLPFDLHTRVAKLDNAVIIQLLGVLVGMGFFGPMYWLRARVSDRRRRIEESLPNALDLMQISVTAGLGFDAAMVRVGNELSKVSPELSFEFLSVQHQIAAGRPRDAAMSEMAFRTGVDIVRSFANVVSQSMQFGSSMSEALIAYAIELRTQREMKAIEMANKLPVKMSGVLALFMMPVLLMITAGPVLIRMIRTFG